MQSAIVVTLALSPGHPVATRSRSLRAVAVDTPAASQKTFTGRPGGDFEVLDVEAMRAASTFPIARDDLIFRCQEVLAANVGTKDPDMLADDFEFAGPVVGPINKEQYLKAVEAALDNIYDAFPELKAQYYDFRVDPLEPNRVWYTSRGYGQMTGKFAVIEPNGRYIQQPPQTGSMSFNEKGQAIEATNGYVMDRRVGNTGGLGAVYAIRASSAFRCPSRKRSPGRRRRRSGWSSRAPGSPTGPSPSSASRRRRPTRTGAARRTRSTRSRRASTGGRWSLSTKRSSASTPSVQAPAAARGQRDCDERGASDAGRPVLRPVRARKLAREFAAR